LLTLKAKGLNIANSLLNLEVMQTTGGQSFEEYEANK
jgi:hypothetical protein